MLSQTGAGFFILAVIGISVVAGPGIGWEIAAGAVLIRPFLSGHCAADPIGHSLCVPGGGIGADAAVLHAAVACRKHNCLGLKNIGIIVIR